MKWFSLTATTFMVLSLAEPSAAQIARGPRRPSLPLAGAITNPDWVTRPDGEAMGRAYPKIAQMMNLAGGAVIRCNVNEAGGVENCRVESETPAGIGFGQAAIQLSSLFKMKPKTVDGVAVGGAEVTIPIAFRVEGDGPAAPPAATGPAPSATALALGRRIVIGLGVDKLLDQNLDATVRRLRAAEYAASSGAGAAGQEVAITAIVEAFQAERPVVIDQFAQVYASQFDEEELAQLADHFENPAQKLWLAKQSAIAPLATGVNARLYADISQAARQRFCQKTACSSQAPSPEAQGAKP